MTNKELEQRWKRKLKGNKNELVRKLYNNWTYLNTIPDGENSIVARYNNPQDYFNELLVPHTPLYDETVKLLSDDTEPIGGFLDYYFFDRGVSYIESNEWIKNKINDVKRKIINRTLTKSEFELFSSEEDFPDKPWNIDWIKTRKLEKELFNQFIKEKDDHKNLL